MKESPSKKVIYIIDDDPIFQFSIKHLIKRVEPNIKVLIFDGGKAAINQIKQHINDLPLPNIIFLDLNMPEMNGWGFLQKYKDITSDLPVASTAIYLCSIVEYHDEWKKAKQNDLVKDFLKKPISGEKLKSIIALN